MTVFFAKRVGNALVPDGDESFAVFSRIPFDRTLRIETKRPRNVRFHRLYFALCNRIASSIGREDLSAEIISDLFKIETGHCTLVKTKSRGEIRLPNSISFGAMDDMDFKVFFEKCVQVAFTEWKIPPEAINDLLEPKV